MVYGALQDRPETADFIEDAIDQVAVEGPELRRPLADRVKGRRYHNMKELRPPSSGTTEIRLLFAFDRRREAIFLVAGNKAGNWDGWYRKAIPLADERFRQHLIELEAEKGEETMSSSYSKWSDVKAKSGAVNRRTDEEQADGKAAARERREAYVRGHQLAEMRTTAGVTQPELADALGVSQVRISKIEHGEISGIDVVRAYVAALLSCMRLSAATAPLVMETRALEE